MGYLHLLPQPQRLVWLYVTSDDVSANHQSRINSLSREHVLLDQILGMLPCSNCFCAFPHACMHAVEEKNDDITHMQKGVTKKTINLKLCIQIKFGLHYYLFHNKIFKTRPHLPTFAQYHEQIDQCHGTI